ncbi:hypothetical protein AVEN_83972-1 [Araneus ventricosus]|uniref:Uncharacterized protein n=1 Tax=Araneus ventricosus TaxID=182803 RepID=A0A4Y2BT87_ARAVE|nr:hypothetical protein AVEN_83972-1 [Araneus ventricosus]
MNRILPDRLLQQYVFHMTTTTENNTLQASQIPATTECRRQWSLIPGSSKTTSPTNLYPSHSAFMFSCCRCELGAQVLTQIAILVCSRLALQISKLSANLSQVCKCETSLQQVNASLEVTIGRTCSKLALQTIAKTEYEHNPGQNSRPSAREAGALTIRPVKL